jgi:hypothetical protein
VIKNWDFMSRLLLMLHALPGWLAKRRWRLFQSLGRHASFRIGKRDWKFQLFDLVCTTRAAATAAAAVPFYLKKRQHALSTLHLPTHFTAPCAHPQVQY